MTKRSHDKHRLGLIITVAAALAYGIWPSAMRAVYADGGNVSFVILTATFIRALPLFAICLLQRRPLFDTPRNRRNALTGGFFQSISSGGALAAVIFLPGPLAVVIMFSHTLMLLGFLIWRKEIKPDATTLLTTVTALIGLTFVLDLWHKQSGGNLVGMGLAFASAVALASRFYVIGHQTKTRHPAPVGAENFIVALIFMPVVLFYQLPALPHSPEGYAWMALGSLSLALGTAGQLYAIGILGSFQYSLLSKLEPLFATLFAALLIREYLQPMQYFGILVVTGSLGLYQWVDHSRRNRHDKLLSTTNE